MGESPLDGVGVDGPLRELRAKMDAGNGIRQIVKEVVEKYARLAEDPELILIETSEANQYWLAVKGKKWYEADLLYMNGLKRKDRAKFDSVIEAEGRARALTHVFREQFAQCDVLWRGASWEELEGYKNGAFESRIEKDGGRRGYKALSMWRNEYCNDRELVIKVPINDAIRRAVKLATYTALPRPLQPFEERIGDAKEIRHADETECRIPDHTRVPRNTTIHVRVEKPPLGTDM